MSRRVCIKHVAPALRSAFSFSRTCYVDDSRLKGTQISTETIQQASRPTALDREQRARRTPWVFASLLAGFIGLYGGVLLNQALQPCHNLAAADISQQKDVTGRYDETADSFDSEVGFSEFLMGINRMRKQLAKDCTGHVLEVSCGTGRNLSYYDISHESSIDSLTFVDVSPQMVEMCKKKWNILFGSTVQSDKLYAKDSFKPGLLIRFLSASALGSMPPPPTKKKYDTVIQTMGLCSTPEPKKLLHSMIEHLDTSNPEARVLLLEHGRSYRPWMNRILDNAAEKHADIHGCWFNRDIGGIVKDAARGSGLQIRRERRHHLGTTWIYELRPSPELVARSVSVQEEEPEPIQSRNWRSWLGFS